MPNPTNILIIHWLHQHPGIFIFRENGQDLVLVENFSGKTLTLSGSEIEQAEERQNSANPGENYLVLRFASGLQLVLSAQGFAFAPNFSNSGHLPLPNQVYCMQDYQMLFDKLRHIASDEERRPEALQLILILIAILDGAKGVGLEVGPEEEAVEQILTQLEKGQTPPSPH